MSKMDDLRAMREARYAQAAARAGRPRAARQASAPAPRSSAPPTPDDVPDPVPEPATSLCGHRAISGRTCTREAGHAAKSHRYS
jgi:hypothetical protein